MKRLFSLLATLLLLLPHCAAMTESGAAPRIMVEGVSPYDAYPGYIAGRVFDEGGGLVEAADYKVAVYVFTSFAGDDAGGYIKPTYAEPFTMLGEDGAFLTLTTTDHYDADNDRRLLYARVLLLPADAELMPTYSQTAAAALDALTVTRAKDGTCDVTYDCGFAEPTRFPQSVLVWAEEFDGADIDQSRWNFDTGNGEWGWGHREAQDYREESAAVEDGVLTLTASYHPDGSPFSDGLAQYTSARLNTRGKFATIGGRIEVRARCDEGVSLWPSAWMLPEQDVEWPEGGELDIWQGNGGMPDAFLQCIQFSNQGWDTVSNNFKGTYAQGALGDWHTYAVEWTLGGIRWYVDGVLTFGASRWAADEGETPAPFNQPFYLGLSLAVGGDIFLVEGESPDPDPAVFSDGDRRMQVDYVRVYRMGQ